MKTRAGGRVVDRSILKLFTRLVLFWQYINATVMHYNGWYAVVCFFYRFSEFMSLNSGKQNMQWLVWNSFLSRDVQRKNVVNTVDMSSLWAPWKNGTYTNKNTEQHKDTEQHTITRTARPNRHSEKNYFLCFSD